MTTLVAVAPLELSMRKIVAAVSTTLLVTVGVVGPIRPAGTEPADRLVCAAADTPACDLLGQLDAVLAPLQPVLAVAGPLLGGLGPATDALAALSGQASSAQGAPIADLRSAADALIAQVEAVARPLGQLLGAGDVAAGLTTSLRDLVDELATTVGGDAVAGAAAPATAVPLPAAAPSVDQVASGSTGATGLGTSLAVAADAGVASRRAVPAVPVGSALSLAPLELPDFGLVTTPAASARQLATEAVAEQLTSELVLPAVDRVAGEVPAPDDTRALQVLGAISVLLLAGALGADRYRKTHHVIPS